MLFRSMQDKVGETYRGTISAVTSFGVFVALDDIFTEGLVHISELGSDYFHFDAGKHELLGERTGKRFRLSDRVAVKVARVDLETSKIDFVLADIKAAVTTGDTPMMPSFLPPAVEKSAGKPRDIEKRERATTSDRTPRTAKAGQDKAEASWRGGKKRKG